MKYCILMGSPRENGNTASLLKPFIEEVEDGGGSCELDACTIWTFTVHACRTARQTGRSSLLLRRRRGNRFGQVLASDVIVCDADLFLVLHSADEGVARRLSTA